MDWPAKYVVDGIAFACEIGNSSLLARLLPLVEDRVSVQPSLSILAQQANFHLYTIYKSEGYQAMDLLTSLSMSVRSDLDFFEEYLEDLHKEWPMFDIAIYRKLLSLVHRRNCMDGTRLTFSNILRRGDLDTIFLGLSDIAARRSDTVMLGVLANLGCAFYNKSTMIMDAVRHGNPDVVEFLLRDKRGRVPEFNDDNPIDIAFKFGSRRILDIVLRAAPLSSWRAITPGQYPDHFYALLGVEETSLCTSHDSCGRSVLHCACLSGNLFLVEKLLGTNLHDINHQDNTGMTVVHVATLLQRKDILRILLVRKPSLQLRTSLNEWTPLHFACNNGDHDVVKMLLESGARDSASCKDRFDSSPVDLACCKTGSLPVIRILLEYGGTVSKPGKAWFSALNCNDLDIAQFLFPKVESFTEKVMGMTIIERACHIGNMEFLKRFLHRIGDFWTEHRALLFACYAGHWAVAQYLIKADRRCLNAPGPYGERPFEACLANDYRCPNVLKTLDFLLMSGVKLYPRMLTSKFQTNLLRLYRENYFLFLKFCEFAQSQIELPHRFILAHVKGKNDHCLDCLRYFDYTLPGETDNVKKLLSLTRLVIRRCLLQNGPIHELVRDLPLPIDCQDYLVFTARYELSAI